MKRPSRSLVTCLPLLAAGCATEHRVTVDPVEFAPIVLTVDVNIRIQRELDEFFDFEDTFGDDAAGEETEETDDE